MKDISRSLRPNIGPRGRASRLRAGVAAFVVGAALAVLLIATGLPRAWRLTLFIPLLIGALGFFQARDKT
ncbi:MAG: hypothetical protein HY700_14260 [Gemmatimonadetes bacterium]|nr:hypothetical protein [Gemmatimonadota bacterium]